jgi:transcriptional regulator with XRE-family HTH domain
MAKQNSVVENKAKIKQKLGKALKDARLEKRFSQEVLAKKVGLQPAYLSQIETGRIFPSFSLLTKLASALGTQASRFMLEAELQKEGDKGQLVYLLAKFLEQAPDPENILRNLEALIDVETKRPRKKRVLGAPLMLHTEVLQQRKEY